MSFPYGEDKLSFLINLVSRFSRATFCFMLDQISCGDKGSECPWSYNCVVPIIILFSAPHHSLPDLKLEVGMPSPWRKEEFSLVFVLFCSSWWSLAQGRPHSPRRREENSFPVKSEALLSKSCWLCLTVQMCIALIKTIKGKWGDLCSCGEVGWLHYTIFQSILQQIHGLY